MGRDIYHLTRLLKAPSSLTLNTSNESKFTASLGIVFQSLTIFIIKNFFTSTQNLLQNHCSLSLETQIKSLFIFPISPFQTVKGHISSLIVSLLQVEQPQLSQSAFIGEVLQPSVHLPGPPLDLPKQIHIFLVLRTPELDAAL